MSKRPRSSSSSAEIIGSNEDLLTEFLLFLPTKSLTKFQTVSKQWLSIISSPSFRYRHTLCQKGRSKPKPSFLLHNQYSQNASQFFTCRPDTKRLVPFEFPREFRSVKILQSCNGLLLLKCLANSSSSFQSHYVFNPITKQYRQLARAYQGLCLVFEPSISPHYKVYCFKKKTNNNETAVFMTVYDSETHTWSDERLGYTRSSMFIKLTEGLYWKESIYFVTSHPIWGRFSCKRFSLLDEQLYSLDFHTNPRGRKHFTIESNGRMHSVFLKDDKRLYVYELSDVDFRWTKIYEVATVYSLYTEASMTLLGMIREERIHDSVLLFHVPGKIMIHRFLTKTFEVLVEFSKESYFVEGCFQFGFRNVHQFIETLVLV